MFGAAMKHVVLPVMVCLATASMGFAQSNVGPWNDPAHADAVAVFTGNKKALIYNTLTGTELLAIDGKVPLGDIILRVEGAADALYTPARRVGMTRQDALNLDLATQTTFGFAESSYGKPGDIWFFGQSNKMPKNMVPGKIADDLRRAVWIENGDLWRCDIDWRARKVVNKTKVTDLGVLENEPFLWAGDHVFIQGNFDPEKPVVRINLVTGEVEEIDWFVKPDTDMPLYTNPSETVAVSVSDEVIYLIDLSDGRTVTINNRPPDGYQYQMQQGASYGIGAGYSGLVSGKNSRNNSPLWVSDTLAVFYSAPKSYRFLEVFSVLDLSIGEVRSFLPDPDETRADLTTRSVMETAELISATEVFVRVKGETTKKEDIGKRFVPKQEHEYASIVNCKTGEITAAQYIPGAMWIDRNRRMFKRTDAGLGGNGTFIHDRRDDSERRISKYTDLQRNRMSVSSDGRLLLSSRKASPKTALCINMETGEVTEVGTFGSDRWSFISDEIVDLGLAEGAASPWGQPRPTCPLPSASADPAVGGRLAIEAKYADDTPEILMVARGAYKYIKGKHSLNQFIDPLKGVDQIVLVARDRDSTKLDSLLLAADFSPAADESKCMTYFSDRVKRTHAPQFRNKGFTVEQIDNIANCIAQKMYAKAASNGKSFRHATSNRGYGSLVKQFLSECEKNPAPAGKSEPMQEQAEGEETPDVLKKLNEAEKKAKKLKKIFGGG